MELPEFHRRVLDAALATCYAHGLVLVGGYAMRAHGLVDRPSQDLDLATFAARPLDETTEELATAYRSAGFEVEQVRGTPLLARLIVSEPRTGRSCAVDVMKMPLQQGPELFGAYPVASLDDIVGLKVAALHGRSVPRDLVDLGSVADRYTFVQLERLGSRFEEEFYLETLRLQLEAGLAFEDEVFMAHGLSPDETRRLRHFLISWYDDLSLLAERAPLDRDR